MKNSFSSKTVNLNPCQLEWLHQAEQLGVSADDLLVHWNRVKLWNAQNIGGYLRVVESCRPNNGRIFRLPELANSSPKNVVAFVPAAGKATRYLLEHQKEEDFAKALEPCVENGYSFLDMKLKEHESVGGLLGQVFVAPSGMKARFQNSCKNSLIPVICLEQDATMSTVRFELDGAPARDPSGMLSLVPAGHGALIKLFIKVKEKFPAARTLWIRNIDNINGTRSQVIKESNQFLAIHGVILEHMDLIRSSLAQGYYLKASESVKEVLAILKPSRCLANCELQWLLLIKDPHVRLLWEALITLFQATLPKQATNDSLVKMYERPFHILGQVLNNGTDSGGAPVIVKDSKGEEFSICLETAHATPEDQAKFFSDTKKLTHFNPVFVAAELTSNINTYESNPDDPFWIIVKRNWQSRDVLIHETPLYEILGNTKKANVLFMEISRNLFNPHKSVTDRKHRFWEDWVPGIP